MKIITSHLTVLGTVIIILLLSIYYYKFRYTDMTTIITTISVLPKSPKFESAQQLRRFETNNRINIYSIYNAHVPWNNKDSNDVHVQWTFYCRERVRHVELFKYHYSIPSTLKITVPSEKKEKEKERETVREGEDEQKK